MTDQHKSPCATAGAIYREVEAEHDLLDQINDSARRHQSANDKLLEAFADIEDQRAASGVG